MEETTTRTAEKITRDCLRNLSNGESVKVICSDGYDLDSQRNTAYAFQRVERCRYTCNTVGLTLTVTRHDEEYPT